MRTTGPRTHTSRLGLILLSFLFVYLASAVGQRLPVRTYTTADGLWSSTSAYLMCDSHVFIWLCTRDGLTRFDGYRFVNYKISDGSSSPFVSGIVETRNGIYWIALNGGGPYRYVSTDRAA
jgi:hypothetical protein